MDWKFKYIELAPPVRPWIKLLRKESMTENTEVKGPRAGNTVESMKPKEVAGLSYVDMVSLTASQNPELICPDIDECAPVINAGPDLEKFAEDVPDNLGQALEEFKSARAAQIPEEIPPTNLWSLRWRISKLEEQMDGLLHRLAQFNIRSGQKL